MLKPKIFNFFNSLITKFQDTVILKTEVRKYTLNLNDLRYVYLEMGDIKISLIAYYLKNLKIGKTFKEHLFNLLYCRDNLIHQKASLIKFLSERNLNIQNISGTLFFKKDRNFFAEHDIKIEKYASFRVILIYILTLISLLSKIKLRKKNVDAQIPKFKSNFSPKIRYITILRAWTELAENIYINKLKKQMHNVIIYLNPHLQGNSISGRQKKYLNHLNKTKRNYFVFKPKINYYTILKEVIKILLGPFPIDLKFSIMIVIIQRHKIDKFLNFLIKNFPYIKEFYTKEEFLPESIYLTKNLQDLRIKVINLSHGLGYEGPITNYDEFYVFSRFQEKKYLGTSKFKYYELELPELPIQNLKMKPFSLLLICQNFISTPVSRTLKIGYRKVIEYFEKIAREYEIPMYAKYHPNSTEEDKVLSNKIKIIENLDELPSKNKYLVITYYSTFVVELLKSMPFLIINPDGNVDMSFFLPDKQLIYAKSYNEFREKINRFIENPQYYNNYWEDLISILKESYS